MKPKQISRRSFVKNVTLAAVATPLATSINASENRTTKETSMAFSEDNNAIRWLDGSAPTHNIGTTFGVPWAAGTMPRNTEFALLDATGKSIPVQTWTTAWWPDGSIKWTASAIPAGIEIGDKIDLVTGKPATPENPVVVNETADSVVVDTGLIRCTINKSGDMLIRQIIRDDKVVLASGRLVVLNKDCPELDGHAGNMHVNAFQSKINTVTVEQSGAVRAVVKIEGVHADNERSWLPFCVRLYFYSGGDCVRMMHSFVFDGDVEKNFISGIGVRFEVPLTDHLYDRHIRFVGEGRGLWAEAIQGLTGLRRDPDTTRSANGVKASQIAGRACPPIDEFNPQVRDRLQYIPAWGDCTLSQTAANAFMIRKRTKAGHGWIEADQGTRASGVGYIGGAKHGGVVFGLRDFWQRHPVQLDVRNAHTDKAEVTVWMYSPEGQPMDLRFYHDGMGMDTFEKQYNGGLEVTYEDYEPEFGDAHGIARSSEIFLWALPATPTRDEIVDLAALVRQPALLVCPPARLRTARIFGDVWNLPDRSTPAKAAIEERLEWQFDFYKNQIDQRHWYGFWHYGDIMHTYDRDRHVWRYDVGGYAWDNSELSPDLWLWYYYLRTGRADVFRLAEAMTRHTGEVDTYHAGRFAGLGSRHNVQHWGCSAKQIRISTAVYRRFYYFLTADERVGDLMRELLDADVKIGEIIPVRKLASTPPLGDFDAIVSWGTDWGNLAAGWLAEWERGGNPAYRDKLLRGMRDLGNMQFGFFTSGNFGYKTDGSLEPLGAQVSPGSGQTVRLSHLNSVHGAVETFAELIQLTDGQPEYEGFKRAWLQYCRLYNASAEECIAEIGVNVSGSLNHAHSRLTAYAAKVLGDAAIGQRAWREFFPEANQSQGAVERSNRQLLTTTRIEGSNALNPIDEAPWVSTNDAAQWGLAAMQCLALAGEWK